jgi:D-alanyl-D-alanine carboxypeptidase/D-alanyl-D-alanine-endopeptidase (penicillin-binding protein 4)
MILPSMILPFLSVLIVFFAVKILLELNDSKLLHSRGTRRFALAALAAAFLIADGRAPAAETNAVTTLTGLASQIEAHLAEPKFSAATWAIKVVSLDSGRILYENHADRLMSPASNSKLYTGAVVLDRFGGDYQIATPVFATAPVDASGTLPGDLIISGRGDPSWNSRRLGSNFWDIFEPFVAVLTKAGVHKISGDIVGDATYFHGQPTGSSWEIDDLNGGEVGEISALTLNDNQTQIRVTPGAAPDAPCVIAPLHPGTGLVFSNQTVTVPAGRPGRVQAYRPLHGETVFLIGQLPVGAVSETIDLVVPVPAAWFAAALKVALARHGIMVDGQSRGVAWPQTPSWNPAALVKIGEVLSPPMRDVVRLFMKPSQNLEADTLLADAGEFTRRPNAPPRLTSEDAGVAALREFLSAAGVPAGDVKFDEGSGLSRNNLTTANATVALLLHMARHREAQDFIDSLPIAGVDGTLRRRFIGTVAAGNVRAKTGTLKWAAAVSGFVTNAAGERLVFSIMLNHFAGTAGDTAHQEIDPLVLMLAKFAGRTDVPLETQYEPLGKLLVRQLDSAPFPHPARAEGHRYHDEFFSAKGHYSDSTVAFFIPKNFRESEKIDFVIHFHGWNNTVAGALEEYQLAEQFCASGKNAILIVPEGPHNAPDSFGGKLEDTNGFANFMAEAAANLRASGLLARTNFEIGSLILSSHSGGYHVMAAILDHGGLSAKIKEVWLFDALYGNTENFVAWQKTENGRLLDIYTDHGGTKDETEKLIASYKATATAFYAAEDSAAPPESLQTNKLVFLHTDMIHNDVVSKRATFQNFLKTSSLENQ